MDEETEFVNAAIRRAEEFKVLTEVILTALDEARNGASNIEALNRALYEWDV